MLKNKNFPRIIIICLLAIIQVSKAESGNQIGKSTTIKEVPYLVQVLANSNFLCNGALISKKFVVTTASCVDGKTGLSVLAGASKLSKTGEKSEVGEVFIPSNYSFLIRNMDVAVLKVKKAFKGNNIKTIGLCNQDLNPGTKMEVSGWFRQDRYNLTLSTLRTINVTTIDRSKFWLLASFNEKYNYTLISAEAEGTEDVCTTTNSGIAVTNEKLCGLVSWGVGCKREYTPGIYTNVNKVKEFIKSVKKM